MRASSKVMGLRMLSCCTTQSKARPVRLVKTLSLSSKACRSSDSVWSTLTLRVVVRISSRAMASTKTSHSTCLPRFSSPYSVALTQALPRLAAPGVLRLMITGEISAAGA